jgi:hypothetical protein
MRKLLEVPILLLIIAVFAVLNFQVRMTVDGETWKWSTTVPQPERFTQDIRTSPDSRMIRGWPWVYQRESGWQFTTKEGNKLFLPESTTLSFWQRISILAILADFAVLCGAVQVASWLILNAWRCRQHGTSAKRSYLRRSAGGGGVGTIPGSLD